VTLVPWSALRKVLPQKDTMEKTVEAAIATFGEQAKGKLANPGAAGQPEDQLRAPYEALLQNMAVLANLGNAVKAVGESTLKHIATRPDYAVTVGGALVGFVELKAPQKGADPRKFKDPHDKGQWERLRSLPNLMYSDGNSFSLWQNGELVGSVLTLIGNIETSGRQLAPPPGLAGLFESFLRWKPVAPRSAKELAETTARLCRLLRDEVTEQLALKSPALTSLAEDWRKLLFPEANDKTFADGYAQAVTFGLLMARAKNITLSTGMEKVAAELAHTSSLIGTALRLLTDNAENQQTLDTSLGTLVRVLDAVDWNKISKGNADAWLYFYEDFLGVYDNELRKKTGSYYTPPEVVGAMVGLVDEALRSPRYGLHAGLASQSVTLADPATGTGTFFLGVLKRIADIVREDEGDGAVSGAVGDALKRLIAFEMQLGPFAVAQLRILAEVVSLTGKPPKTSPRMFVTNTLSDPEEDAGWIPTMLAPLADQRKNANKVMRDEAITVVLGNPPYKEKAKGKGSWIESGAKNSKMAAPLAAWMPPREWGAGAHAKHLRNLYIYFWRWATWKVYDHGPGNREGIVCFISVAGFLNGKGFQQMRAYLRETCDDIWVIDCSPEGHQPEVNTRIFQDVQQPVCIVMVSRSGKKKANIPASVRFQSLPNGRREEKFAALAKMRLSSEQWIQCPTGNRSPFLPESTGAWSTFPKLESLFVYSGSGVMPGRTWIIAPDINSLQLRWQRLVTAPTEQIEDLFHPHIVAGAVGDRHSGRVLRDALHGFAVRPTSVADDTQPMEQPVQYGFRSFDREWIIPDKRLINRPNPELWQSRSDQQIYLTAFTEESPTSGPALTFTGLIPDLHHYKGSFGGRAFPLWSDHNATESNIKTNLLAQLSGRYGYKVDAPDLMAYIAAVAAHPFYTAHFQEDLSTPGLRIPVTADSSVFSKSVEIGTKILWLHTFGERMTSEKHGRPQQPPRLPVDRRPTVPKDGFISEIPEEMPDLLGYDVGKHRLLVGQGYIDNVTPAMWAYEVSGKQVLLQWFSYRKGNRERPIIGDRRKPSALGDIQPDHWLPEYTTELLNVLNVLGLLIDLEWAQADLLKEVCAGSLISETELIEAGALESPAKSKPVKKSQNATPTLF
jgi:hypothetical protein